MAAPSTGEIRSSPGLNGAEVSSSSVRRRSLRWNVVWTFGGNLIYGLCQMGLLLVLAALGSAAVVGQFGLGLAVSEPVFGLANLGLRNVQATDSRADYGFLEYLLVRLLTTSLAFAGILAVVGISGYTGETAVVVLLVAAAKAIETLSDITHGRHQRDERLERVAKSKLALGVLGLLALAAGMAWTGKIVIAAAAFAASRLLVFLVYDFPSAWRAGGVSGTPNSLLANLAARLSALRPSWRRLVGLIGLGVPIGGTSLLVALNKNIPRYVIAHVRSEEELGIFCVLSTAMMAGTLLTRALNQATAPRLAHQFAAGNMVAFRRVFRKRILISLALGSLGVLGVWLAGEPLMNRFAAPEYSRHADILVYLMMAAGMTYLSGGLETAMIAVRRLRPLPALMGLTVLTSLPACFLLVPADGLRGAAIALAVSKVPYLAIGFVVLWRVVCRAEMAEMDAAPQQPAVSHPSSQRSVACAE